MEGSAGSVLYTMKVSYSKNYGSWRTSLPGFRSGGPAIYTIPPTFGLFTPVSQLSSYLELALPLKQGLLISSAFALDKGKLLEDSFGGQLRMVKSF